MNNVKINLTKESIKSLAKQLYPEIIKFFQSEEDMRKFEEWKKNRNKLAK